MNRNSLRAAVREFVAFCVAVARRFDEERATQTAGSLAYTTLLSMVPLFTVALAVALAVASSFPAFNDSMESLRNFVFENALPDTPGRRRITEQIDSFMRNAGRLTAIGIVGFTVTAMMLMLTIDNALNRIFRVPRRRPLLQNIFVYLAIVTLAPVLIGVSLSLTTVALTASVGSAYIVPFFFTCMALSLLYGVVPARRVALRHALAGGIVAGIAFEVAKRAFALYLQHVPTYALIYGAFATIPLFLIWLYVSWLVVLAGAVFTAMLPEYRAKPERTPAAEAELGLSLPQHPAREKE